MSGINTTINNSSTQYSTLSVTDITSSSVSLLWNLASNATESTISCEADFTNTSVDLSILGHVVTYTLSVNNSLNTKVEGLLPATYYNCCITTTEQNASCRTLTTYDQGLSTAAGLSPVEAGVLGGFLGCFITLVIALIVAAVLVSVLLTVKRKKAITRAKARPVLRSDSKHYKRKEIPQKSHETATTPTQHKQVTSPPQSTPTTPLQQTKYTPLPAKHRDPQKSATAPGHLNLKPMLPLKPPIKQKPYPLRRAKSQQEAFSSQVGENVDEEHIYDDADLSFKTRRIVSRENVAYEMEDGQQEYELL